jgi:hypothetical protein
VRVEEEVRKRKRKLVFFGVGMMPELEPIRTCWLVDTPSRAFKVVMHLSFIVTVGSGACGRGSVLFRAAEEVLFRAAEED